MNETEKQRKTEKRERDSEAWGETHSERRRSERGGSQWKDHEKNYKRQRTPPPRSWRNRGDLLRKPEREERETDTGREKGEQGERQMGRGEGMLQLSVSLEGFGKSLTVAQVGRRSGRRDRKKGCSRNDPEEVRDGGKGHCWTDRKEIPELPASSPKPLYIISK